MPHWIQLRHQNLTDKKSVGCSVVDVTNFLCQDVQEHAVAVLDWVLAKRGGRLPRAFYIRHATGIRRPPIIVRFYSILGFARAIVHCNSVLSHHQVDTGPNLVRRDGIIELFVQLFVLHVRKNQTISTETEEGTNARIAVTS